MEKENEPKKKNLQNVTIKLDAADWQKMLDIYGKNRADMLRRYIRAQYLLSGTYDYSEYDSWDDIFEVWAAEVGGWDYYAEELPDECITAEESRARLLGEFAAAAVQTSIEECILNDDRFGIAKACGYLE